MEWKKYTIKTKSEAEDIITGMLADLGIYSVEIEDSVPLTDAEKAQMFVDIAPVREDDGCAYVSFYVEAGDDYKTILMQVQDALKEVLERYKLNPEASINPGELTIATSETEDEDWINNWKQYFKQFYIDDILFIPSWEKVEDDANEKLVIHIDPGTAFGTGKHETTQLCIRELRNHVKSGDRILDVGTGSGVLAMLALKFGAKSVFATDLDPCSVDACKDNFFKNGLKNADFNLIIGNIIDDKNVQDKAGYEVYDVVVANILADILIPLTPAAVAAMKKDGVFITSGIIEGREKDVADAMKNAGLEILDIKAQGEWRCVVGKKI